MTASENRHFHYRRSAALDCAAEELGINLLLTGRYPTETFGVKALAAHLAKKIPD